MKRGVFLKGYLQWLWAVLVRAWRLFFEPLRARPSYQGEARRAIHRLTRIGLLIAASLGGAIGAAQFVLPPPFGERIKTVKAEWKFQALEDGTGLQASPNTDASVRYSAEYRRLYLEGGEIFAEVAHEPARPFEIVTAAGKARAVGTKFSMAYSPPDKVWIGVVEGAVKLTPTLHESEAGATARERLVPAGESISLSGGRVTATTSVDPSRVRIARGTLIVEGATIEDVATYLNVRGPLKFVVDDSRLASIVIKSLALGRFEPQQFTNKLASSPNIAAEERGGVVHLRLRPGACPAWLSCVDAP